MKKARLSTWTFLSLGLVAAMSARADIAGQQFSAEMVQQGPKGQVSGSKMYVGDGRVRTEMSHQGQQVVRIVDEERQVEWILFPDQKKYMERRLGGPSGAQSGVKSSSAEDPCAGMAGFTCRKVGEETIDERPAIKWEMVVAQQGQTMTSTQWIDKERGVPLRVEMPNGMTTELKLVGEETLNDRKVEKWEMLATQPNQQPTRTFQWYDPELTLAVRQEYPGGFVSEMKDIRVGEQPDHLFSIPAGYERISAPQAVPGQALGDPSQH